MGLILGISTEELALDVDAEVSKRAGASGVVANVMVVTREARNRWNTEISRELRSIRLVESTSRVATALPMTSAPIRLRTA
jgi:hypothetical protein